MKLNYQKEEYGYCQGKKCYDKRSAQTAANYRQGRGARLRIYQCPECNHFHLTSKVNQITRFKGGHKGKPMKSFGYQLDDDY